ncbi:unnamed protein product [Polarella glacialis]|uniref:Uncharacterized protein n=1 Tax=Polarella glacialis TaxID=89957 RepID=A0A813GQB8_POLGL|nr:unnamed protein product [Polarella glacialis]CAE8626293.1 unnamed protein product [Polarella glacialis]
MARYKSVAHWVLHTLFVLRSDGEQRLQELLSISRRQLGRVDRRKSRRGAKQPSAAERFLRSADQLSLRAVFSPADGLCDVDGAVEGLQLSECSIEAEVFMMERLFVTQPPLSLGCGAAPVLLRVGSAWDGDAEVFQGFASVVPASSTDDLWLVLTPLTAALGQGSCQAWQGSFETQWSNSKGEVVFRGGGRFGESGVLWERYLGPSPLPPGSYRTEVLSSDGQTLGNRSFEVLPDDPSSMVAAERLARLGTRYFELVAEPETREAMDAASLPQVEPPLAKKPATKLPAVKPASTGAKPAATKALLAEDAKPQARPVRRQNLSSDEVRKRERAWLEQDVRQFAPVLKAAGAAPSSSPGRPRSDAEKRQRELQWIRRDVQLYATQIRKTDGTATEAKQTQKAIPKRAQAAPEAKLPKGPPWPPDERERREKLWLAKEAERLQKAGEAKRRDPPPLPTGSGLDSGRSGTARPVQALKDEERELREEAWIKMDVELYSSLRSRRCAAAKAPSACARILGSSREDARRTGLTQQQQQQQPQQQQQQHQPQQQQQQEQQQQQKQRQPQQPPPPKQQQQQQQPTWETREPSQAKGLSSEEVAAQIKASLNGSIPENVVDRELPWILQDIAIGQKLTGQRK